MKAILLAILLNSIRKNVIILLAYLLVLSKIKNHNTFAQLTRFLYILTLIFFTLTHRTILS